MKKPSLLLLLILTLFLIALPAGQSHAAPAQQANLLQNPGLERPFPDGAGQGWGRWFRSTARTDEECLVAYHYEPKWNVEANPVFVHSGSASQLVGNSWDTWSGGIYQNVPATPGTTYRFSFYGRGRGANTHVPDPSESGLQINMRAGIDPDGSGSWSDADVVWGAAGSPHDTWQQFSVEATATGNQITVFTSADWGVTGVNQCRAHLDTWYDTAELIAVTPPTATPAPLPTQGPTQPPPPPTATVPPAPTGGVPTEAAAATVIATMTAAATETPAGQSAICVNAFLDVNANGVRDADEGNVAGVTLTIAQGNTIVGQAVSSGTAEPVCIGNLLAGTYQVGQSLPPMLEMTTQANATIELGVGQTVALEFGSRVRTTPDAEAQPTATDEAVAEAGTPGAPVGGDSTPGESSGGTPSWLVYVGVGAILVGVVLLGALLFTLLRR